MQHRYFGDVGDFGKYGLLRALSGLWGGRVFKLGVVWYLFPDEDHNADGKHIGYLRKPKKYRDCDEHLFDNLGRLIDANRHLSNAPVLLPEGTVFYDEPLAYRKELPVPARLSLRKKWFADAFAKMAASEVVFVDPDNGIECESVMRTAKEGPKYVYWDDIDAFVKRGQSLVIYHHPNRKAGCSHPKQIEDMRSKMKERFGNDFEVSAVRFRRGTSRAYFVIASPLHKDLLGLRLTKMLTGPWNRHFE